MSSKSTSGSAAAARLEKDRAWAREWATNPFRRSSTIANAADTAKGAPSADFRRRLPEVLGAAVDYAEDGEPEKWVELFLEALNKPAVQLVKKPEVAAPAPPPPPQRALPTGPVSRDTVVKGYEALVEGWGYLRTNAENLLRSPELHVQAQGRELLGAVLDKERNVLREMAKAVGADKPKSIEDRSFPAYLGPYRANSLRELIQRQGWTHDGDAVFDIEDSPTAPPKA